MRNAPGFAWHLPGEHNAAYTAGTLLHAAKPGGGAGRSAGLHRRVTGELERGLGLVAGWETQPDVAPGWVGLACPDVATAAWMQEAIVAKNVAAWREGECLLLLASPDFALDKEIKNVVTAATHNMQAPRCLVCWYPRSRPRRRMASGAFFVFVRSRRWPQIPRR